MLSVKFFAFILACMVLVLSCMPCTDCKSAEITKNIKTELAKPGTDKDTNHKDACSPFCHCGCCAGFSINHPITPFTSLTIVCSRIFSSYFPDKLIEISLPIWQPPKA